MSTTDETLRALSVTCERVTEADHEAAVVAMSFMDGAYNTRDTLRRALTIVFASHRERTEKEMQSK